MKVLLTSCTNGPLVDREKEQRLRYLHAIARESQHTLVDSPEEADLILVGNLRDENDYRMVRNDPLIARYPDKCFGVATNDQAAVILHGIYASAEKSKFNFERVRAGSYGLAPNHWQNRIVEQYAARQDYGKKKYLFCFIGRASHPAREQLFSSEVTAQKDVFVKDSSDEFDIFAGDGKHAGNVQTQYCEVMMQSKFALCPRGRGTSTIRLFEAMQMGIPPVIIADDWLRPTGPDWDQFALFLREKEVPDLYKIISRHEDEYVERGRLAKEAYDRFFADDMYFNYIVENCIDIARCQKIPERVFWTFRQCTVWFHKLRRKLSSKRW